MHGLRTFSACYTLWITRSKCQALKACINGLTFSPPSVLWVLFCVAACGSLPRQINNTCRTVASFGSQVMARVQILDSAKPIKLLNRRTCSDGYLSEDDFRESIRILCEHSQTRMFCADRLEQRILGTLADRSTIEIITCPGLHRGYRCSDGITWVCFSFNIEDKSSTAPAKLLNVYLLFIR